MTLDSSEKSFEDLIVSSMAGRSQLLSGSGLADEPAPYVGLSNYVFGELELTRAGEGRQ